MYRTWIWNGNEFNGIYKQCTFLPPTVDRRSTSVCRSSVLKIIFHFSGNSRFIHHHIHIIDGGRKSSSCILIPQLFRGKSVPLTGHCRGAGPAITYTIRTFRMTHAGCDRGTRPNISKPEAVIYRDERAGKSYKRGPFLGKVCRMYRYLSLARYVGRISIFPWQGM